MAGKIWISAKTVKIEYQSIPDWVYPFEAWWAEKITLHGQFKEGQDYRIEKGEYFLSSECEEKIRKDELAGVMGKSCEAFERSSRHVEPQQTHGDTGDDAWQAIVEGRA